MEKILIILSAIFIFASFACGRVPNSSPALISKNKIINLPNPRVHFNFNSDEVEEGDLPLVMENAEWMKLHKEVVIILEGHCDELGATDYNIELGDRRARNIKSLMVERGVPYNRIIMVVSYGDSRPLDSGHSRDAWDKNRRVEFIAR